MKRIGLGRAIKKIRLATGGAWKLRSLLFPNSLRQKARNFFACRQHQLVFVLGTGRSGTQLVSDLLATTGNALIYHEPNFIEDVGSMEEFRRDSDLVCEYWERFRKIEIYRRWSRYPEMKIYGEVNGTIRYHVPGIKSEFPDARLLLLSRDGRGVVRSVMGWPQFYGPHSEGAYAIQPLDGDTYAAGWNSMSRFEKICWAWMEANEYLLEQIPPNRRFRLEQLVKDFTVARSMFDEIGLDIDETNWQKVVTQPSSNASKSYSFPEWDNWDSAQQARFLDICGRTMDKLGYRVE